MMPAALREEDFVERAVSFAEAVDPITHIKNKATYEKALLFVSALMDRAPHDPNSTLNGIIETISKSRIRYA